MSDSQSTIVKRGECGDNVTFTLDENGVLIISGNGDMRDFEYAVTTKRVNTPWWGERKTISLVRIQNGVTSIGQQAFRGCAEMKSVAIPDGVVSIKICAFWGCAGLTKIAIPDSVTSIGNGAFWGCAGLTGIAIPDSVTSIGQWAFADCEGLTSVIIPDSAASIERGAFLGCEKLKNVSVPAKAKIYPAAFPDTVRITRRA